MIKEQLEQEKARLDKEYKFKLKVADRFKDLLDIKNDFAYTAFISQHTSGAEGIVSLNIENIEDAGRILTSFDPTFDSYEFRFASKSPQQFGYPYKLDIKNNFNTPSNLKITFTSEGMEIWIHLPISQTEGLLDDYIKTYTGRPTDSEADIYLPRLSRKKVSEYTIPCIEWNGLQISYYGRQKTLTEEGIAETIIENFKKVFSDY